MPTNSSRVGAQPLPVPPGAAEAVFVDPLLHGLADFLRFSIKDALDAELATQSATSADALPAANVYGYDPATHFVRNAFPALYLWWTGKSARQPRSIYLDLRVRKVGVLYVFAELTAPGALQARSGLLGAVDAALFRASEHGYHPAYGYQGAPPGTPLVVSLPFLGWAYEGGEPGFLTSIPSTSAREGFGAGDGAVTRGYLSLRGEIAVYEQVTRMGAPVPGQDPAAPKHTIRLGLLSTEDGAIPHAVPVRGEPETS